MAKSKTKLPKTVLGVKVPKQLRRSGAIAAVLASPTARKVLADALIAAAGAAAAALAQNRPSATELGQAGKRALETGGRAASGSKDAVGDAGGALGSVLSEVARTIIPGQDEGRSGKDKAGKGRKRQKDARVHH